MSGDTEQALTQLLAISDRWHHVDSMSQWRGRKTLGAALRKSGRLREAEQVLRELLSEAPALEPDENGIFDVHRELGLLLMRDRPQAALRHFEQALEFCQKQGTQELKDPRVADLNVYIGLTHIDLDRNEQARDALSKAASYYRATLEPNSADLLAVLRPLAYTYVKDEILDESMIRLHEEILEILREVGASPLEQAQVMHPLATAYAEQRGDWVKQLTSSKSARRPFSAHRVLITWRRYSPSSALRTAISPAT
jgi:tetratricopeptide (TPR) repeat protein